MALFINGVGQDTFSMNGVSIDNLYVDGVLVWSSYVNTKPVISIIGDNPMYLVLNGSAYVEQGATATDIEDGDITNDIVIGGDTPDVSVEGYYYVTYNVTDSEGLAADEQIRTVSVYVVTIPKYELTETLINDGTFDYVDDSNNPDATYNGKLTESDGTTPYEPTELQYPKNDGLLELASGRIMDTQFNALTNRTAMYGIYGADGSTVYNIWALEYISLDFYNLYEGDQDTPLAITVSSTPIFPPDESTKVTDERPSWLPSLEVFVPIYISFNNGTITSPPPDDTTINNIDSYADLVTVWQLVDKDNSATTATMQLKIRYNSGYTGLVSGNNSYCIPDAMSEDPWRNETAYQYGQIDFVLPAGTYDLTLGAMCNTDDAVRVGRYEIGGVVKNIDAKSTSATKCETWTGIVSDGATPITLDTTYESGSSFAYINGIILTRTA